MNIPKVCNSADFVNYVKPEVAMIEMEIEGNLLLTASGGGLAPGLDQNPDGGNKLPDGGNNTGGGLSVSRPRVRR